MNMKKTIAAIAAGAVAVSAMATTVSAVEAKTLNYNLTNTLGAQFDGKVTVKATFPNVPLTAGKDVKIRITTNSHNGWGDKIVVGGQYIDVNKTINPMTFTKDEWTEGYGIVTATMMNSYAMNDTTYFHEITIPVESVNTGKPALIGSEAKAAAAATTIVKDATGAAMAGVTVQYTAFPAGGNYTLKYVADPAGDASEPAAWFVVGADGFTTATKVGVNGIAAPADGDTITVEYTEEIKNSKVETANITVNGSFVNINSDNNGAIGSALSSKVKMEISTDGGVTWATGDASYSGLTAATKYKMPFRTTLNDNKEIIYYLEHANLLGDDATKPKSYKNVKAVLNDAIENYDGVTFTFNTAASKVKYVIVKDLRESNPELALNELYTTVDKATAVWQKDLVVNKGAWNEAPMYPNGGVSAVYNDSYDAVDTYTAFGEHTYDWYYAPESTGFTGYDWGGTNLFAGALIVNEYLTMSLSNAEYFDWTKTSVSFDWEAIMDNAATTNNFATYIQTLKLATSNLWFWDSMDVVLTVGEADDVSADAGVTADDATLDDDDDIVADDDDDDVEPADDDDDDEPAPVVDEPAPVAPVATNPPTGNAPVALAVIPVALAAAAIVAKKRG